MLVFGNLEAYKQKFPKEDPLLIKKIVQQSNLLIGKKILAGEDFLMPESLGIIFVAKEKTKKVFDYITFCKTGVMKTLNNFKTFGFLYKVMWFKGYKNKKAHILYNVYKFKANRVEVTRPLSKILQAGNDYYKEMEYVKRFYNGNKTKVSKQ